MDSRNQEIENICKERSQIRQSLEAELTKARAELEAQISENNNLIARHEEVMKASDDDFKYKNE